MQAPKQIIAKILGGTGTESNILQEVDATERRFGERGCIEPPYSPQALVRLWECSNSLRPNVDAYATNIDGFGHRYEPVIDLDAADADQRIAHAMYLERLHLWTDKTKPPSRPTDEEVEARKKLLVEEMRLERTRLNQLFDFACEDISFVTLRRRLRQDLEIMGNAFVEILRDGAGRIAEFVYVPAFTVRLRALCKESVAVKLRAPVSELSYETVERLKRFRTFVQIHEQEAVYFKEFGDPRVISRKTGEVVKGKFEEDDGPATELLHLKIHSPRSVYGVPRWIGVLVAVMGSRASEEVNYTYFDNKTVPPMALLVSGGHVADETVSRIEMHLNENLKGRGNFHKILILEASGDSQSLDSAARTHMQLKPLMDAQQKDALFQVYDQNNQDKVGQAFRLPRLLRGDIRDFNRSTAEAALEQSEQQVFAPEREEFDFLMNRRVLTDLGIKLWRFRSNSPRVQDSEQLAKIVKDLSLAGIITPEEARQLAESVFSRELPRIDEAWVKQPIALTLAGMPWEGAYRGTPYTGEPAAPGQERAGYGDLDADGTPDEEEVREAVDVPVPVVTPTTLSSVLTVNEVRQSHGFGPKLLADGSEDPRGDMTIADYVEEMRARHEADADKGSNGKMPKGLQGEVKRLLALRRVLAHEEAKRAAEEYRARREQELLDA